MAILFGTTGDGTTLPVLVDQFGNLLAKGIPGDQGPPGPPGVGELPDNPYEGALLGWENNELAWVDGYPPLPAGTFGPFIYSDFEGTLTVPQDASSLTSGDELFMSSSNGDAVTVYVQTSLITNVGSSGVLSFADNANFEKLHVNQQVQPGVLITAISGDTTPPTISVNGGSWYGTDGTGNPGDGRYEPAEEWSSTVSLLGSANYSFQNNLALFDGNTNSFCGVVGTGALSNTDNCAVFALSQAISTTKIEIYGDGGTGAINGMWFNDNTPVTGNISSTRSWQTIYDGTAFALNKIRWGTESTGGAVSISAIKINGFILIDSSIPGGPGEIQISVNNAGTGTVSVSTGSTIELATNNQEWIDGFYVTV